MQFDLQVVDVQQSGPQKMFGEALQLLFLQARMMAMRMVKMKASWELFRFFSSNDKASIQFAWGAAWALASFLAHFVHRWFTFDKRKSVQWTIGFSTIAYAFSLTGSTYTIGLAATQNSGTLRMLGILNMLVWGVIIWVILRILVFQYKTED